MYLLNRKSVSGLLRTSVRSTYRIPVKTMCGKFPNTHLVEFLNRCRTKGQTPVDIMPVLLTPEEVAKVFSVSTQRVLAWTKRKRNPLPAFKLTGKCYRFGLGSVADFAEHETTKEHTNG